MKINVPLNQSGKVNNGYCHLTFNSYGREGEVRSVKANIRGNGGILENFSFTESGNLNLLIYSQKTDISISAVWIDKQGIEHVAYVTPSSLTVEIDNNYSIEIECV